VVLEHLHIVALVLQNALQQGKMQGSHVGDEDLIVGFHLLGEFGGNIVFVDHRVRPSFRAVMAANRLRRRMLTAPRLVISSILIWVYSLPPFCRMSRVSSVVMASTPQPKLTSCTSSMSGWLQTYLAAA